MTRINAVPPHELSTPHLLVENWELVRVYVLVRKAVSKGEMPERHRLEDYRMGEGHVRFFYTRLGWLRRRELMLHEEILRRKLVPDRPVEDVTDIPSCWFGDWEPSKEALGISRERLRLRTRQMERHLTSGYAIVD